MVEEGKDFICIRRTGHNFLSRKIIFLKDGFPNQVAIYTGGRQLEWMEVESAQLPSPRSRLRAAMVDNIFYLSGGFDHHNALTSILSWNPYTESWQPAGNLAVARYFHAAVAVPWSIIESECS